MVINAWVRNQVRGARLNDFYTIFFFSPRLGLKLAVVGKAETEWIEPAGKSNRTFRGEERYINYSTFLSGDPDGDLIEIPIGNYSYKFACHLPTTIPYSIEGEHGSIRYKVDAKLEVPWTLIDLQSKLPFTVVRNEDLNAFPELRLAQEVEEIKKFCWGWCGSRPLVVKIRIPKCGFALGENVPISLHYCNDSNTNIDYTNIALIKKEKFICSDPVTKDRAKKVKVFESLADGVRKNSELKIDHCLQIPKDLPTSNRKYSQVLQISYELKIVVSTAGCCSSSPILKFPITIGNVGILEVPSININ